MRVLEQILVESTDSLKPHEKVEDFLNPFVTLHIYYCKSYSKNLYY